MRSFFLLLPSVFLCPLLLLSHGVWGGDNNAVNDAFNETKLDCEMRMLAIEFAAQKKIHSWREEDTVFLQQILHDALQMTSRCRIPRPKRQQKQQQQRPEEEEEEEEEETTTTTTTTNNNDLLGVVDNTTTTTTNGFSYSSSDRRLDQDHAGIIQDLCDSQKQRSCIFVSSSSSSYNKNKNHHNNHHILCQEIKNQGGIIVKTAHEAVSLLDEMKQRQRQRQHSHPSNTLSIVFLEGTHFVSETLVLGNTNTTTNNNSTARTKIILRSYPGHTVWLSGGIPLKDDAAVRWRKVTLPKTGARTNNNNNNMTIMVANLQSLFWNNSSNSNTSINSIKVPALFSKHRRWVRARYPNANPETDQWGEYAPNDKYHISGGVGVKEWIRPPRGGQLPTFTYFDFTKPHDYHKNDSIVDGYNLYASGSGGVCADLWGDGVDSYWCANASEGGGADIDRECATTGQLQIPIGMKYSNDSVGQRLHSYRNATGAIIHAWHSRSWAMHMFQIEKHDREENRFDFTRGSGSQGGRNWCRCDQCPDARPWCGQNKDNDDNDTRLLGGDWIIENVMEELDAPGEFYFDPVTLDLYVVLNETIPTDPAQSLSSIMDDFDFRFAVVETLIRIENNHHNEEIEISDLGFRDVLPTYMGLWQAPSGGDWALHRGGAVFLENSTSVRIEGNRFHRLDGNAVFLSRRNRNTTIAGNMFEWIGENAVATWGDTDAFDGATREDFPMETYIIGNMMREIGIFQKQSSAVALAKSARTTVKNNMIWNLPRAGINFNDGMGGGDVVEENLLFNTCRESGDHGPINSWDRQPFLTRLRYGHPSFTPETRVIAKNFLIANYGSDQAVDNDDGSSYFHVHHNVWYDSGGVKCDWGGHDSIYEHNLITSYPDRWNEDCVGFFGEFKEGHGHIVRNNTCVVPDVFTATTTETTSISVDDCAGSKAVLENNTYFSPDGSIGIYCYDSEGDDSYDQTVYTLEEGQRRFGLEKGTVTRRTPSNETEIVVWAKNILW